MTDREPAALDRDSTSIDFESIRSVLADNGVTYAVVFGSVARGEETSTSDVDLCVRFPDEFSRRERFDRRNRIDSTVQRHASRFVDVSDLHALPDGVALNALRTGVLIYGDETTKQIDERKLARRSTRSQPERAEEHREFIDQLAEGNL